MIEGIRAKVSGKELKSLYLKRAEYHEAKQLAYERSKETMKQELEDLDDISDESSFSNIKGMNAKAHNHKEAAAGFRFLAEHTDEDEIYLLNSMDLRAFGVSVLDY